MILQIALVLLIFFFFFLTYMVTKGWRWFHVVCLVAVFFTSIAFLFFAAFTLKTKEAWQTIANSQEERLEAELEKVEDLLYGARTDVAEAEDNLRGARIANVIATIDRGRIWRNCAPQNVAFDQASGLLTVTLDIPPKQAPAGGAPAANPDPNDPNAPAQPAQPAAAGPRHTISEKTILFGFMEVSADPADPNAYKVPAYYLGEYFASGVTPTSVTLRSVVPPGQVEVQLAQGRQGTWALYEVMPTDGHKYFVDAATQQVDEAYIRSLLSPVRTGLSQGSITQQQYDEMIQEYVRHGKAARDEDPPERKWVKVQFTDDYDIKVNADRPEIMTTDSYDSQGLARSIRLQQTDSQGKPKDQTSFAAGDEVIMDSVSADNLEQLGKINKIEEIYVRELRDYEYSFHQIYRRIIDLEESIRNTDRDIAKANDSIAKMRHQITYREGEKAKLNQDLGYLNDENAKLEAYIAQLTAARNDLAKRLSGLYQHSNALEIQLGEMQAGLKEMIEARAARAVAEVGTGAGP